MDHNRNFGNTCRYGNDAIRGGGIKSDPEMDNLAVWVGSGCMAVSSISGLRLFSPLCTKCLGMKNYDFLVGHLQLVVYIVPISAIFGDMALLVQYKVVRSKRL